jgi:hypothetical protein
VKIEPRSTLEAVPFRALGHIHFDETLDGLRRLLEPKMPIDLNEETPYNFVLTVSFYPESTVAQCLTLEAYLEGELLASQSVYDHEVLVIENTKPGAYGFTVLKERMSHSDFAAKYQDAKGSNA